MNPWLAFCLGVLFASICIGITVGYVVVLVTSTPKMALASLAAVLRGFAGKVRNLNVVLVCQKHVLPGENLFVSFAELATCIENAELASVEADGTSATRVVN